MDPIRPAKETPHSTSSASRSFASRIRSPHELPPGLHDSPVPPLPSINPKKLEKEQKRLAKEAEKEKRAAQQKLQRERAHAVIRKRQQIQQQIAAKSENEFQAVHSAILSQPSGVERRDKPKTSGTQKDVPCQFSVPPGVAAASTYGLSTGRGTAPTSSMSLQSYTGSPRTSHSVEPNASALSTSTVDPPFVGDFANQNISDLTISQYHTLADSPSTLDLTIEHGPDSGLRPS